MTFQEVDSPHPVFQARAKAQRSLFNVTPQLRQLRKPGNTVSISCRQRPREKPAENLDITLQLRNLFLPTGVHSLFLTSRERLGVPLLPDRPAACLQLIPPKEYKFTPKTGSKAIPARAIYGILLREYKDDIAKRVCRVTKGAWQSHSTSSDPAIRVPQGSIPEHRNKVQEQVHEYSKGCRVIHNEVEMAQRNAHHLIR